MHFFTIHFHVLKHSIATHLLDAGADLRFVQDWVGHASIKNTVIYAQLASRRRDEEAHKVCASPCVVYYGGPESEANTMSPVSDRM
ncbi:MAG: tyrosine-type recombinase/integrase [Candidatus Entotheonellia bacterium]